MAHLAKQQGCTLFLVTHDHRIRDIADRTIRMENGQLVSSLPPAIAIANKTAFLKPQSDDDVSNTEEESGFITNKLPVDSAKSIATPVRMPNAPVRTPNINDEQFNIPFTLELETFESSKPENDKIEKIYKVLCIDDSSTIRRSVEAFLDPTYFQTISVSDLVRALAIAFKYKPDMILLDIMMPELDGYQLCSMLRKHHLFKNTPIIMITSRNGFIDKTKAKVCGTSDYLVKPFDKVKLMTKIFQYLV